MCRVPLAINLNLNVGRSQLLVAPTASGGGRVATSTWQSETFPGPAGRDDGRGVSTKQSCLSYLTGNQTEDVSVPDFRSGLDAGGSGEFVLETFAEDSIEGSTTGCECNLELCL